MSSRHNNVLILLVEWLFWYSVLSKKPHTRLYTYTHCTRQQSTIDGVQPVKLVWKWTLISWKKQKKQNSYTESTSSYLLQNNSLPERPGRSNQMQEPPPGGVCRAAESLRSTLAPDIPALPHLPCCTLPGLRINYTQRRVVEHHSGTVQ